MQDEKAISYRLSPQQELVWAMSPDGPTDAGQLIVELEGPVDIDRLRNAFSLLADRHEILRSTYVRQPGMKTPLQVVRDAVALDWEVVDLSGLDPPRCRRAWSRSPPLSDRAVGITSTDPCSRPAASRWRPIVSPSW